MQDALMVARSLAAIFARFARTAPPSTNEGEPSLSYTSTVIEAASACQVEIDGVEHLPNWLLRRPTTSRLLLLGMSLLGKLASLLLTLSRFRTMMFGCSLLATTLICRQGDADVHRATLRQLLMARRVQMLVLAALLVCTQGAVWIGLRSAAQLWSTASWVGLP